MDQSPNNPPKTLYPDAPTVAGGKGAHPGKPLTHRFEPGEKPRQIIEPVIKHGHHIASEVSFNPVTTMSLPDKNVYVRPVRNVRPRHISPLPLEGPINLPIRGERIFDITSDFQRQLEKRVGAVMSPYEIKPKPAEPEQAPPKQVSTKPTPQTPPPQVKAPTPPAFTPAPTQPRAPFPTKLSEPIPARAEQVKMPAPKPAVAPKEVLPPPPQPQITPVPSTQPPTGAQKNLMEDLEKIKGQLVQEASEKQITQERILELTNKYQSQIASLSQEKNSLSTQMAAFNQRIGEEMKRREATENRLATLSNQFRTEIEKMKIERDGLLGRIKELQTSLNQSREAGGKAAESQVEITQLKGKVAQLEREKSGIEERAIKLEGLVNELKKKEEQPPVVKEVVVPQRVEEGEKPRVPVQIVEPAQAVGKMAPALTTIPNVVNGVIRDTNGMLLTEVVIVVKDQAGNPVRALKSNKIGQFAISTPLPNGTYTMELEKEDHQFDVVQIKLEGKVMPPIEIRAR